MLSENACSTLEIEEEEWQILTVRGANTCALSALTKKIPLLQAVHSLKHHPSFLSI
jgi:hypothetical protein